MSQSFLFSDLFNYFEVLTSSSFLYTGVISLFLAIFWPVISLSGPITHRFFPGSYMSLLIFFRRSLILFNYDVSMNFISHIPSSRSIWIISRLWLNLAFFFIPECLSNSWCCPRHHSQLAIGRSVSLNLGPFSSWFIVSAFWHHLELFPIMSNIFLAIRCISELFSFSILRRPSFHKILRSQLSAFVL